MTETTPGQATPGRPFLRRYGWVLGGLVVAILVVLVLAPLASSDPDGLNRVAEDKGFSDEEKGSRYEWLPGYSIPGVENEWATVVLAGLIGVGVVFVVPLAVGSLLKRSRRQRTP